MKTYTEQELRELDAWVAEHLMGEPHRCLHLSVTTIRGSLVECDACHEQFGDTSLCMSQAQINWYSTDPAAAMQVLEKCAEKLDGFEIVIGRHQYRVGEPNRFMVCSSNRREFQSIAQTLPLAICLFAKQLFGKD